MHLPKKAHVLPLFAAATLFSALHAGAATPTKSSTGAAEPAALAAAASAQEGAKKSGSYGVKLGGFFTDAQRNQAKHSISQKYAKAKECPPGMERETKKAACAAPVKGHYWAVGQSLQPAVKAFPVPPEIAAALPPAPEGYKYLLAGEDVLLVSDNSINLVVDIIQDVMG